MNCGESSVHKLNISNSIKYFEPIVFLYYFRPIFDQETKTYMKSE